LIQHSSHIDELIALCAAGEAHADHWNELAAWCDLSTDNARYADQLMAAYNLTSGKKAPVFDSKMAWQKVEPHLKEKKVLSLWMKVAGVAAVALFLFLVFRPGAVERNEFASTTAVQKETLADGSSVVINKKSKLEVAFDKGKSEMQVKLSGEAFFDLNKKQSENFEVLAGGLTIRDIGTSFNVKAPQGNDTIWITVSEGVVQAMSDKGNTKTLQAGESALFIQSKDQFIALSNDEVENTSSYKDRKFSFKNTPLRRIVRQLNEVYDEQLILKASEIGNCRLTVTFDNESMESIAAVIAETLGLQTSRVSGGIELNGEGCE